MSPASFPCPPTESQAFSIEVFSSMRKVKHYFTHEVKHCFLTSGNAALHNQGMLDSEKLAALLVKAMAEARPPVTNSQLAAKCNVTKQAVTGWRSDGRIAKRHLQTIAELTGKPLTYFLDERAPKESHTTREKTTPYLVKDTRLEALIEGWPTFSDEKRAILYDVAINSGKKGAIRPKVQNMTKGSGHAVIEFVTKPKQRS